MSAFTEKERLAYQADGFVIRRNQFTHSLMARVNRALDVVEKELLAAASIDGRAYAMDGRPFVILATGPCNLNLAKRGQRRGNCG